MYKQLVVLLALVLLVGCDKRAAEEKAAGTAPQAEQASMPTAGGTMTIDQQVDSFRAETKKSIADLQAQLAATPVLQETIVQETVVYELAPNDAVQAAPKSADPMLTDVKTRLDRLGTDIDKVAAKTEQELKDVKKDVATRLEALKKDVDKVVSKKRTDGS